MSNCCDIPYPIIRNGTSQADRLLKELMPKYIKIDERSIADIISFAHDYAKLVNYYNSDNKKEGDWQPFFEQGDTVLLALMSCKDLKLVENEFEDQLAKYDADPAGESQNTIDFLYEFIKEPETWRIYLSDSTKMIYEIGAIIKEQLQDALVKLISYNKNLATVNDYSGFYDITYWGLTETIFNSDISATTFTSDDLKKLYKEIYNAHLKIKKTANKYFQFAIQKESNHSPHVTLFISFLFLFKYAQDHINKLTKKHLDFYYKQVLKLEKNDEIPDKVHVIFELAKNYSTNKLSKGTLLKAGKDDQGNKLYYGLDEEMAVNQSSVSQLKTIYIDSSNEHRIYAATKANSFDGEGTDFEEDSDKNWKPFGSKKNEDAEIGFAITSPILLLKEGDRKITITFNSSLSGKFEDITNSTNYFKIKLSTDEQWYELSQYSSTSSGDSSGYKVLMSRVKTGKLKFEIRLKNDVPAITEFDSTVLEGDYDTKWPMIQILLNDNPNSISKGSKDKKYGYDLFKNFKIEEIDIKVECEGIRDLIIQNDFSVFEKEKPFLPFGPEPILGSNFYIGCNEVFSKSLDSLQVVIDWLDLPEDRDFFTYYKVNRLIDGLTINKNSFKAKLAYLYNKGWNCLEEDESKMQSLFKVPGKNDPDILYYKMSDSEYFNYLSDRESLSGYRNLISKESISDNLQELKKSAEKKTSKIEEVLGKELTKEEGKEASKTIPDQYKTISIINFNEVKNKYYPRYEGLLDLEEFNDTTERGFIKVQLAGMDFQHSRYNDIYTFQSIRLANEKPTDLSAVDTNSKLTNLTLPNEPYTPNIRSLYLNYSSSIKINLKNSVSDTVFKKRIEKTFQVFPFGHKEVHPNLKENKYPITLLPKFLYSTYESIGNLYIGLKDAKASQNISLLFQGYEGSGNPEKTLPTVKWKYLKKNEWIDFTEPQILKDTTKSLVKSGIIKFSLPSDITSGNTILDKSLYWIKGSIKENIDALPDLIDVKAQAAVATYKNCKNSDTHLETALAADTIGKLDQTDPGIKSISQPYASFGGKTSESSDNFYIRVSERLRHKNRAITLWDYEHLVLNEFPSIYKVKCINHTYTNETEGKDYENAPGHVMVVVIPDLRNKNAVNLYEPKVDVGTLSDIADFLAKYNTPAIRSKIKNSSAIPELQVVNPYYERVMVSLKVKFYKNYDKGQYKKELNNDIKKFLSPWAYNVTAAIDFGNGMHKSVILHFIEKLVYVDYLTDFKIYMVDSKNKKTEVEIIECSRARSIITTNVELKTNGLEHVIEVMD